MFIHPAGEFPGDFINVKRLKFSPRTGFFMMKIGGETEAVRKSKKSIENFLTKNKFKMTDASKYSQGSCLQKIVQQIYSVGFGVVILAENYSSSTLANIFYEVGLFAAQGKPVYILTPDAKLVPSDFAGINVLVYEENNLKDRLQEICENIFDDANFLVQSAISDVPHDLQKSLYLLMLAYLLVGDEVSDSFLDGDRMTKKTLFDEIIYRFHENKQLVTYQPLGDCIERMKKLKK